VENMTKTNPYKSKVAEMSLTNAKLKKSVKWGQPIKHSIHKFFNICILITYLFSWFKSFND
jgi:hypothetical protein